MLLLRQEKTNAYNIYRHNELGELKGCVIEPISRNRVDVNFGRHRKAHNRIHYQSHNQAEFDPREDGTTVLALDQNG